MMKILLDQGLPLSTAERLRKIDYDAVHTGEVNLSTALDSEIIEFAVREKRIIVTLDSDFHAWIALESATAPTVIRIREEGLKAEAMSNLIHKVILQCNEELSRGALVSATTRQIRIRNLPIKT